MLALQLHYICIALLNMGKGKQALNDIVKRGLSVVQDKTWKAYGQQSAGACVYCYVITLSISFG